MFNLSEWSEYLTKSLKEFEKFDDIFFIEAKETRISIKSIDDQEYLLTEPLYVIGVKNLSRQQCQLLVVIKEPEPDIESINRGGEYITVRKGQYIDLKHKSQYQESLKKREEKDNQLPQTRFKNWAKDIWDTEKKSIIVGLIVGLIVTIISFLLHILAR